MENTTSFFKGLKAFGLVLILLIMANLFFAGRVFGATITNKEIKEGLAFCADYPVGISYNGEKIAFSSADVPPVIITPAGEKGGRTLIPARALFEKMGGTVHWDDANRAVNVALGDKNILLIIDSDNATVDGTAVKLDVPALIIDHDGDYKGSTMIPVRFVAEALGCEVGWEADTRTVAVKLEKKAEETPDQTTDKDKDTDKELTTATDIKGNTAGGLFPKYDMSYMPLLCEEARDKIIMIDPGHGGNDCGAIGHKGLSDQLYEKDLNLPIALKLRDLLENAGATVKMIRTEDEYSTIYDRSTMANEEEADLYVAVHNNSTENNVTKGTMVLYSDKLLYGMNEYGRAITITSRAIEWAASDASIKFDANGEPIGTTLMENYGYTSKEVAEKVMKYMLDALGTKKFSMKEDNRYVVLNSTRMPSIIVEGAFLSNEEDFKLMKQDEFIERYAYGTARGIIEAFNARFGK